MFSTHLCDQIVAAESQLYHLDYQAAFCMFILSGSHLLYVLKQLITEDNDDNG